MRRCCLFVALGIAIISRSATAAEEVSVYVEYRHGPIHVHYTLPCADKTTCTLTSSAGADNSWHIEVTPTRVENGLVAVTTVIKEDHVEATRFKVLNRLGESAKMASVAIDGSPMELTIKPF